jgi:diguanylate cyclase (GGDEF)-like protein
VRGLPDEDTRDGVSPLADVEKLVIEGRYGRADLALRRLEALIPGLATATDTETLLLALYGRALLLRQLGAGTQNAIAACDVLERAAHEREAELWVAAGCATRARFRVDSGDIGGATADLARADAEATTGDLTNDTGYRLLDGLALVYSGLRLHDRADEMRSRIEHSIGERRILDQAQHWSTWSGELAARAMEPLAGGAQEPQHELMGRAIEIAAKLDELPEDDVPSTLRRGARGVRALSAAYRGRPSEALRLLGPDAFGTVGDLPLVERQIVSLAAMRAHALVGSLATARSLDDAAAGAAPTTLPNLVLEVCRTRERLWLETYAGGDVIPVLHRMTELLVRLGWRGMDLVADTARQALEHQALRTESRTDALTGVGNRRALDEELRQLLRFGPLPLSLILVDIDHFKGVNDVFTHVVGDEVLKRVAASLSLQLRTDDQLLRYGGDEFVVLLPGTGDEEADAVADRMRAAVRERPWGELAEGLEVSVTTGVAAVWSLSGRRPDADAEKLFRRADERLLEGKRSRPEEAEGNSRSTGSADITVMVSADSDRIDDALPVRDDLAVRGDLPTRDDLAARDDLPVRDEPATRHDDPVGVDTPVALSLAALSPAAAEPDAAAIIALDRRDSKKPEFDPLLDDSPHWSAGSIEDEDDDDSSDRRSLPAAPAAWQLPSTTPARSRTSNRVAMRPQSPPERRPRSAFDPDPDDDLDTEALGAGPAQRASGRRDARPRAIEGQEDAERGALNEPAPIRSRREARAANRPEVDPLRETSAGRDAAEADAAAREVAKAQAEDARKRAAREARARDDAARDAEIRLRAEQEKLAREAELRERAAQERLARERAAREKAQRQAAEVQAREKAARERAAQERAAREAAQVAAREAAEAAAREAAENAAREAAEVAAREAAENAAREAAENERRRAAERIRAERERREAEARERERHEAAARAERERREAEARERERHEAAARAERERREAEARERARHEAAIRAERERREAEARARTERERLLRERLEQERLVKERRDRELREAEIRDAERLRQEARDRAEAEAQARMAAIEQAEAETEARVVAIEQARVRAEAEAERARASDQIREEAYARAAELARRASSGPIPHLTSVPGFDEAPYDKAEYDDSSYDDEVQEPAASDRPLQRRAPLYDASRRPDQDGVEPFRERRSHPRPTGTPNPAARGGQSGHTQPNPVPPRLGPNGAGQNGAGQNGFGQPAAGQNGAGQNGFGQNGFGQNGSGRNGAAANGTGPNGQGPNGLGPNGQGPNGQGPNGLGPNGQGPNGLGPNGLGPNGVGRNGVGKNRPGQNIPGQNIPVEGPEDDPDSPETIAIRTRREPFGPPTRSQAIIDLSARKRPRNPYTS